MLQLLHPALQPAADSLDRLVHHVQHLALLLQLAAHVACLAAQVADGLGHAVQVLVLFAHHAQLLLVLELGVGVLVVVCAGVCCAVVCAGSGVVAGGKGSWVGRFRGLPGLGSGLDGEFFAHVFNLAAHLLDEAFPAGEFGGGDAILGGVGFDGLDGGDQVGEVFGEGGEGGFEVGEGGGEFGRGRVRGEGADAEVGGEEGTSGR